ncbi:hypothetical protein [Actinobacillus capsulatus]|uniref:hypothetical protein n=1 Tax=Actinobacillus capsulatus TaxID=717 RepID=UPI00037A92D0|nr:hypothetical protein [Actinobacillus capsulatus]
MANITLSHITPRHFFEAVKLLKMTEHRIYLTVDSLEVRFRYDRNEPPATTDKRFQQLEHFMLFLQELVNSDVPVDLEEFICKYRKSPVNRFPVR